MPEYTAVFLELFAQAGQHLPAPASGAHAELVHTGGKSHVDDDVR